MADAHESSKLFSKRWRAKIFSNDDAPAKELKSKLESKLNLEPKPKPGQEYKPDDELNAFLKPSAQKANAQKEAAIAGFLAGANKPRIDVAKAQRWPGAHDLPASAGGRSPSIAGGLRTGTRKKGLTVSFARTQPDIIGEGGDECAEPSIEVFKRKKSYSLSDVEKLQAQSHQDDSNLGTRSPKFGAMDSVNQQAQSRGIVTRTLTSHGELSPPLQQKLEMGHINTHASQPPPTPHRLGQMGLGERRPKPLQRAPTGFDIHDEGAGRQSMDSTFSNDSENASPAVARKAPHLPPTFEEEDDFKPQPLKRSQTGWSEHGGDSEEPVPMVPAMPRLQQVHANDDDSPLDGKAFLADRFLQSEPSEPNSFSARVMHKMRAEEGKALHEGAQNIADDSKRDSASSANSFQPGAFQAGTPPKPPPRAPYREPLSPASMQRTLDAEDPQRSRARGPSPARRPMPPGTFPLNTDPRPPSSASSQYTVPSAASKTRASPTGPMDAFAFSTTSSKFENAPFSAISVQQTPSVYEKHFPSPAVAQNPQVPPTPQYERGTQAQEQPPPPTHVQLPNSHTASSFNNQAAAVPLSRSDTRSQGEIAFSDFAERVTHMQGIFRLTAELGGSMYNHAPIQWLRVAIWWFLSGRAGMETLIRSRPKNGEQPERLAQPHVDLAKTWWIVTEIIPNHPSVRKYGDQRMENQAKLAKEAGDAVMAEVYEVRDIILYYMKMLLGSMKRHQSMPPTQALIQGQDQSIWIEYPNFAPDAHSVLSGTASKPMLANGAGHPQINPASCIPLGDTKTDFCYFRMFVKASLSTDDPDTDRVPLPVIISILRPREGFKVKLAICSQSDLVNVTVGTNPDAGPTWRDVAWKSKTRGFTLQMRHGFNLNVDLSEQDFRSLWSIVDHTNRVESNLRERSDERFSCQMYLREVSYRDSTNPGAFPPERVKGCKLIAFEKFERSNEGGGRRRLHRGYRVVVVTNANNRTLSCVNHEMGTKQEPMNFEYTTDAADNAPGMILRFREETPEKKPRACKLELVFNDNKDRNQIFGTFTSMNVAEDEDTFAQVPLKGFSIESADPADGFSHSGKDVLKKLQWQEAKVLNTDPVAAGLEAPPTVKSESLRIVCRHGAGVISDRMNLGVGELLVRLPIDGAAELTLLRNPQQDMAVAVDATRTPDKDVPGELAELLRTLTSASTIRKLTFDTFKDLHTFQLAVTGFHVKFDGLAATFSISRRRMVVPIYKQWTANKIRLQIVEQDNIIQLVAFFQDFSHADAMNFQLKSMDTFEKMDKSGKACVRLVDAKFPLPVEERRGEGKMGKEEGKISGWAGMKRKYICLDTIEYPGEHDDIVIAFDSAETRDRFVESLPAAAEMQRKFTVRRK
ncbi:hypothetical protein K505DRAFT_378451 [Melanomma pulvis-pyrius CBS 109.77]|uniref:Uncharacterized protein n=1 Tax=Melanomma pulvis-pyrius CBS 109.77 TaxID=1314802 RepID=A0A6A6WYE3_9PLEO|nr:hypothetical protein K505DRAFT_378451 [Melanomma pulvis-pyrius CBS 109.77]